MISNLKILMIDELLKEENLSEEQKYIKLELAYRILQNYRKK